MTRRVTLLTIAEAVGVSRTTVSNAYSRPDQLTPELRDRIMAAAERLGYAGPNAAARGLRTGRVGTIALVFTDQLSFVFSDPNTTMFMRGVAEATAAAHVGLTLLPVSKTEPLATSAVLSAPVDGYLVFSIADGHPVVDELLRRQAPTVVVDEPDLGDRTSFVGIDDRCGARLVAEHIAALGHRKVGVLVPRVDDQLTTGPVSAEDVLNGTVRIVRERYCGYVDGLTTSPDVEITTIWAAGGLTPDSGREATLAMYDQHPDVTAILCMTDQLAIGACQALSQLDVSVPGDVSVTGFDDIPRASTWAPTLTTVRQPLLAKGQVAAEALLRQLDGGDTARTMLPIELVTRESTASIAR